MCSPHTGDHQGGGPLSALRTEWANLAQPGPWGWKFRRFVANTSLKIARRQPCCGHPGEPGC
jgi:hypothetical protein